MNGLNLQKNIPLETLLPGTPLITIRLYGVRGHVLLHFQLLPVGDILFAAVDVVVVVLVVVVIALAIVSNCQANAFVFIHSSCPYIKVFSHSLVVFTTLGPVLRNPICRIYHDMMLLDYILVGHGCLSLFNFVAVCIHIYLYLYIVYECKCLRISVSVCVLNVERIASMACAPGNEEVHGSMNL